MNTVHLSVHQEGEDREGVNVIIVRGLTDYVIWWTEGNHGKAMIRLGLPDDTIMGFFQSADRETLSSSSSVYHALGGGS